MAILSLNSLTGIGNVFIKFLKNAQLRILLSGTLFTSAFIWMAVTSYGVSQEEIKVFLIFSFLLVSLLIVGGLFFSVLLRLVQRGRGGLLVKVEQTERENESEGDKDQASKP